jgi:predicted O-methyltransferase YrrM
MTTLELLDKLDKHMERYNIHEGYTAQDRSQAEFFSETVKPYAAKRILEIGFNSGHSCVTLMASSSPDCTMISFDLGEHYYVDNAKVFVDQTFPGRHTLIKGNSLDTIRTYSTHNPNDTFDIIFIDGGHYTDVPLHDTINCMSLAHENTILIIDDIVLTNKKHIQRWNHSPNYAWSLLCECNYILPIGRKEFMEERPNDGRGFAWGKYNIARLKSEPKYKRYKPLFKNQTRPVLFNTLTHFYNTRDRLMLAASSDLFLDYFEVPSERDTQLALFYKGFALAYMEPDEAIRTYESLLKIPGAAEDLTFFTNCNLPQLYAAYNDKNPQEKEDIPKIIHLLYFGETEFHNFHDRCVRSMLFHMLDYKIIIYNNVEPVGNEYWDKLKTHPRVTIEQVDVPTHFDGFELSHFQYKADVVRLEILYNRGGVYLDLDMLIVKNFDEVFKTGKSLYLSKEGDGPGLINAFIAAKPKNEFLKIWLDNFKTGLRMGVWAYHIRDTNRLLIEKNPFYISKHNIEILKSDNFFPVAWTERDVFDGSRKFEFKENNYGVHLFETILFDVVKRNDFFSYIEDAHVCIDAQYNHSAMTDEMLKFSNAIHELMKVVNEVVVITTEERTDRHTQISNELLSKGLAFTFLQNKLNPVPVIGCLEAHISAIHRAKESNYDAILILEDDVVIQPSFSKFSRKLLPAEWDMLYLGGILTHTIEPQSGEWIRGMIWCNHAYIVKKCMYDEILNYYYNDYLRQSKAPVAIQIKPGCATTHKPETRKSMAIDDMYSGYFNKVKKCWLAVDQYFIQREDFSNIDNRIKWANNFNWNTFSMKYI